MNNRFIIERAIGSWFKVGGAIKAGKKLISSVKTAAQNYKGITQPFKKAGALDMGIRKEAVGMVSKSPIKKAKAFGKAAAKPAAAYGGAALGAYTAFKGGQAIGNRKRKY